MLPPSIMLSKRRHKVFQVGLGWVWHHQKRYANGALGRMSSIARGKITVVIEVVYESIRLPSKTVQ